MSWVMQTIIETIAMIVGIALFVALLVGGIYLFIVVAFSMPSLIEPSACRVRCWSSPQGFQCKRCVRDGIVEESR